MKSKEVFVHVKCPGCFSFNVKNRSGVTADSYPPHLPFVCVECGKEFWSQTFKVVGVDET